MNNSLLLGPFLFFDFSYTKRIVFDSIFLKNKLINIDIICEDYFITMNLLGSFSFGGFVPSAAIAGVLLLVGLGAFFYLGIKGPTDY